MILPGISHHRAVTRSVTITLPGLAFLTLVSVLLGVAATWEITRDIGVPQVVRGTIAGVNQDVTAIAFRPDGSDGNQIADGSGEFMILTTDLSGRTRAVGGWDGCRRAWRRQDPSYGQRVELGIVKLERGNDFPPAPSKIVVSVRCLNR